MFTTILLPLTFVFGIIYLLTLTKLFDTRLSTIFLAFIPHEDDTLFKKILVLFGTWFFYFSLCYQAWYWLFSINNFN